MTFETPIQPVAPVPARGARTALLVGVLVAATAGLLVWQPWSGSRELPGTASATASPPPRPPAAPSSAPAAPSFAPATPRQAGVALVVPRPLPTPPPGFPVGYPSTERFRARWSVIGGAEDAGGGYRITQLPLVTTSGFLEGRTGAEVCTIGRLRSAFVAMLPGERLRLLGVAGPPAGIGTWVELGRIDGPSLPAYELPAAVQGGDPGGPGAPDATNAPDVSVHLFVRSDFSLWERGVYRFFTAEANGAPHFLYACLVESSVIEGR